MTYQNIRKRDKEILKSERNYPCFEEHANLKMIRMLAMEAEEFGHIGEVIHEHRQLPRAYELIGNTKYS